VQQQHADLYHRFSGYSGDEEQSSIQRSIDNAFRTFGRNLLTPRERDVVEYVLKGNSSAAIGRLLNISAGTVQIHRNNIYQKLGINSQGELFSQFISGLTS
jgi:DNA-binding CsgD family transcriptional regulator